jgi:P-type E1-E2 ATPase
VCQCVAHNFYEAVEKDAQLVYLGLNGQVLPALASTVSYALVVYAQEDQLQLLVPETIEDLVKAGVNVWMITGDKLAAAKSIGMACNLIGRRPFYIFLILYHSTCILSCSP